MHFKKHYSNFIERWLEGLGDWIHLIISDKDVGMMFFEKMNIARDRSKDLSLKQSIFSLKQLVAGIIFTQ